MSIILRITWLVIMISSQYAISTIAWGIEFEPVVVETLPPVIVTATRTPHTLQEIIGNVEVITASDIEQSNAKTLPELLKSFAGLTIGETGGIGQLSTLSIRGGTMQQSLILIDGLRINNPQNGGVDLSLIPLNCIDRIEIVQGGTSSLYGADALGGVINIITKSFTTDKPYSKVIIRRSSNNTDFNELEFGSNFKDKFDFYLTGGTADSDGFRPNSDCRYRNLNANIGIKLNDYWRIRYNTMYTSTDAGTPGVKPDSTEFWWAYYEGVICGLGNKEVASLFNRKNQKNWLLNTNLEGKLFDKYNLTIKGHRFSDVFKYDSRMIEIVGWDPITFEPDPDTLEGHDEYRNVSYAIDTQLDIIGTEGTYRLTFGAGYTQDELKLNQNRKNLQTQQVKITETNPSMSTSSMFVQQEYLHHPIQMIVSLRCDYHSDYGFQASHKLGVSYHFNDNIISYVSVGKSFRAPTFNDLYWPEDAWSKGNPDLLPEIAVHYEFGTKITTDKASFSIAVFRNKLRNLISWGPSDPTDPFSKWTPLNIGKAMTQGIEYNCQTKLTDFLIGGFSCTALKAIDLETEEHLVYRPMYQLCSYVQYEDVFFGGDLGVRLRLAGEQIGARYHSPDEKLPAYYLLNLKGTLRIISLKLFYEIDNLTDTDYEVRKGYPMPGQRYTAGIQWEFWD